MKKIFGWLTLALLLGLLAGCGSSRDSADTTADTPSLGVDPATGIAYVGAGTCVDCHQSMSFSDQAVSDYLASKHVIHSDHINAASDSSCLACHDSIGNRSLEAYIDAANVPANGLAAVGCENCHGAGGKHFGVGPIPSYNPDFTTCGNCHDTLLDNHIPFHPLGNKILTNYKLSAHFEGSVRSDGVCMRCHSDEGFRTYINQTLGLTATELEAAMAGKAPVGDDPIQCRTCHDPHSGGMRVEPTLIHRLNGSSINGGVDIQVFSSQFNLCTSCHQVFVDALTFDEDTDLFTYQLADPAVSVGYHDDGAHLTRIIADTHFADGVSIVGYNINAAAENACTNCHDPHSASKFDDTAAGLTAGTVQAIAEDWANQPGFHGDYMGPGFEHGCTPCHSPEGLIQLTKGAPYAEENTEVGVIACVACHDLQVLNAAQDGFELGARRDSPEFAFDNARTIYAAALAADPNTTAELETIDGLGDSALCMTCHSGRESTASVNAKIAASAGPYSFTNIHYLAAGATLFGNMAKGGYEYDGKSYSSKFEHVDSYDLCIECHDVHTGQLKLSECAACHTGVAVVDDVRDIRMNGSLADYDGDGDTTEGMYYEVSDLIDMLELELNNLGIGYFPDHYPYFWPVGTVDFSDRANASQLTATQLKAAYNLQVSKKDPGTYAHNGTYIIELLYDSIQDLGGDVSGLTRDAAGHFDAAGEPFRHWDEDPTMSTSCARCHSSEGAAAFFTNGTVAATDFKDYTRGISAGLACEACHTAPFDPAGVTRSISAVSFDSGVSVDINNAAAFFAAGNDSPLCISCHQGRSSTTTVNTRIAANNLGFSNIHYYAAAASLFGDLVKGGYQYTLATSTPGAFVSEPAYVGTNAFASHPSTLQTCEGCHLQEGGNVHSFTPDVTRCNDCHTGATFDVLSGSPGTNYTDIVALKTQLLGILNTAGITYDPANYPYFSGITTAAQLKAAYNLQVAEKEPCGYIHNGDYIKQLLCDSIVDLSTAQGTPVAPMVTRP